MSKQRLPWRNSEDGESKTIGVICQCSIDDAHGGPIAYVIDKEQRARILRAVNYHDRLMLMVRQIPYLTGDGDVRGAARRLLNEIDKET